MTDKMAPIGHMVIIDIDGPPRAAIVIRRDFQVTLAIREMTRDEYVFRISRDSVGTIEDIEKTKPPGK